MFYVGRNEPLMIIRWRDFWVYPINCRARHGCGIRLAPMWLIVCETNGLIECYICAPFFFLCNQDVEFSLTKEQERWVIDIMLSVTLVKLALVIYCRSFTNEIVKAYAQDHFFDVVTNVIGLIAALLANYINGWIDPVGAIIVSYSNFILFFC